MDKIDFLKLYADAAGLRIMLLANRFGCNSDRERVLHDWVATHLARFIAFTRSALAAERSFRFNTDPAKIDNLGEDYHNHVQTYRDFWQEEDGCDIWDVVPEDMEEFLSMIRRIYRDLKIVIPGWGLVLPGVDIDEEPYEPW
ncbi:hypothetical protein ATER59S_00517 [Aquamicrobium terrae]